LDRDGNVVRINSKVDMNIADANGINNSLNATFVGAEKKIYNIGGFVGRCNGNTSYTAVSSYADIEIVGAATQFVGGFMGLHDNDGGVAIRNVISRGVVTVPSGSNAVAAFFGSARRVRLSNVLISTDLNVNGSTENIGTLAGEFPDREFLFQSSYYKTFTNNQLGNPVDVDGLPSLGTTAELMKSATFLKANGFDLSSVFRHQNGQWPIIRTSVSVDAIAVPSIRRGRTNSDTSISVGAASKNGLRSYYVNMPTARARKVARLVVVRNGKVVKQIHIAPLNRDGNWYTTSKYELRSGDVLRLTIDGKKVRALNL
jgi:hypothetical protein